MQKTSSAYDGCNMFNLCNLTLPLDVWPFACHLMDIAYDITWYIHISVANIYAVHMDPLLRLY